MQENEPRAEILEERVIQFPKDYSIGTLRVLTVTAKWGEGGEWVKIGKAQGVVKVPVGRQLSLEVTTKGLENIEWVAALEPTTLHRLILDKISNPSADFLRLFSRQVNLQILFANSCQFDEAAIEAIAIISTIKQLIFDDCDTPIGFLAFLKDMTGLEELGLRESENNISLIHNLPFLKRLGLDGTPFGNQDMQYLTGLKSLEWLDLSETPLGDEGLQLLTELPLKYLSLSRTLISDTTMQDVAQITTLEELILYNTDVTNIGIKELAKLPHLRYLDVRGTAIDKKGISYFRNHPSLEVLGMYEKMMGTGIAEYTRTMPHFKRLET